MTKRVNGGNPFTSLDGVDWTKVDFQDNQECLNLFEKTSLSAARRSFASDNTAGQPGRLGSVSSPRYDSEEATSLGPGTPGASTPFNGAGCQANGSSNAVSNLLREFEQCRQIFGDDTEALVEV